VLNKENMVRRLLFHSRELLDKIAVKDLVANLVAVRPTDCAGRKEKIARVTITIPKAMQSTTAK